MKNIVLYLENAELMYSTVISLRQGKKKKQKQSGKKKIATRKPEQSVNPRSLMQI